MRPLFESMGPSGRIHLHADQAITGTIEKGVTIAARSKARGASSVAPPARITLAKGRPLPIPPSQRVPLMFSRLLDNRLARGQLFGLFPDALDSIDAVRAVLPHCQTQELHFLGFHAEPATEWRVGKGASEMGR
eukprot:5030976-Prymnesium_polylepis.1